MSIAERIAALVEALRRDGAGFEAMPPAQRRHLAALCRYIADRAEGAGGTKGADKADPKPEPKSGVLAELKAGAPRHE